MPLSPNLPLSLTFYKGESATLRLALKLESLDAKFKVHHNSVIELIESEEDLEREQDILDQQDDTVSELGVRVKKLISVCSSSSTSPSSPANLQIRKLRRLEHDLGSIRDSITSLDESVDNTCRLQLYQEQLSDFKRELVEIRDTLLSMGVADTEDLMRTHDNLEKGIFDSSLRIGELLHVRKNAVSSTFSSDLLSGKR